MTRNQNGFTLVELLASMSLMSIIMLYAIPMFTHLTQSFRPELTLKSIKNKLHFARLYSINHGVNVTVCPLKNNRCNKQYWNENISVFIDLEEKHIKNSKDILLFEGQPIHTADELSYPRKGIQFKRTGGLNGLENGTFTYCTFDSKGDVAKGLEMSILYTGRARIRDTNRCKDKQ